MRRRAWRLAALAAVVASLGIVAAGCGGGGDEEATEAATTAAETAAPDETGAAPADTGAATEAEVLRAVGVEPTARSLLRRRNELLSFLRSALVAS